MKQKQFWQDVDIQLETREVSVLLLEKKIKIHSYKKQQKRYREHIKGT